MQDEISYKKINMWYNMEMVEKGDRFKHRKFRRRQREERRYRRRLARNKRKDEIQQFTIKKLSTENKELYGSVKPTEISKMIHEIDKIEIKPSMIQLKDDIKTLGIFKATINLHAEVQVEIKIQVIPAETIQ